MSPKLREPSTFYGTPEEDGQNWLSRFEIVAKANGWGEEQKASYVKLYLEGKAGSWIEVNEPESWEDFVGRFLKAFRSKQSKFSLASKLRNRQQGVDESVELFVYDILKLCKQVETEQGEPMTDALKIDWILHGLDPELVGKILALAPGTFQTVDQFIDTAVRFEVAEQERRVRLDHRAPRLNAVLSEKTPGLITREEFDQHTSELKQIILRLEKKLSIQEEPTSYPIRPPPRERDLIYPSRDQQQPDYYQRSARDPDHLYATRRQPQPVNYQNFGRDSDHLYATRR